MMMENSALAIAFLVSLGALSGVLSGMLGIGGGVVVVPALILGLPFLGIDGPALAKIAMATSLATVIPTTLASAQGHAERGGIDWYYLLLLLPSFVIGAFVAAAFIGGFSASFIILVFILVTLFSAHRLWRGWKGQQRQTTPPRLVPLTVRGIFGGALSSLLGIGAALVAVPYLERFVGLPRAIGTAAALALPMAMAGTAAYLVAPPSCAGCLGYVYPPAVAAIGIAAVLTAPIGVWLAHAIPVGALKKIFAVFLVLAAGSLGYKTFTLEVIAAEASRVMALGHRFMAPQVAAMRPAEAPLWIGSEPAPTPYFTLVRQYGPQRAFSPLIVERDEVGPTIMTALFARGVTGGANGFNPTEIQADITRMQAMASKAKKTSAIVTAIVVSREQKLRAPARRKPTGMSKAPSATRVNWLQ